MNENARILDVDAEEEARRRYQDLALINALNHAANRGASLAEIIALLCQKTREVFSSSGATVYLL